MLKTVLILPDGTELSSGVEAENAIISVTVTESVNESQELTLGSVCAGKLEAKIRIPSGISPVAAGEEVSVYKEDTEGTRYLLGIFALEKPVWASANTLSVTAYDRVTRLDKDLTEWVNGLVEWPMSLLTFAKEVCDACGLTLTNETLLNGDHTVRAFTGSGITGRQLIRWAAQAAGCFARATPEGNIEFAWYTPVEKTVTPDGDLFCYQDGLSCSDYATMPIEKVQLQLTQEDVGTVYPDETGEKNTYKITGNYLLTAENSEDLEPVAENLFSLLQTVTYTPCKVTCPIDLTVGTGSILQVTDRNGKTVTAYVMTRTISGQRMTLECTGSYRRDSTGVVNETGFRALSGKVLELTLGVEGIRTENRDTAGKVASLELTVDGLSTGVSQLEETAEKTEETVTELSQTAQQVKIDVQKILTDGVDKVVTGKGYSFTDEGLQISDAQSDIQNTLDHTGMYVNRGEEVMLQANKDGVVATDVTVRNYLVIGHARFEEYSDGTDSERTACFFV